MATTDAVCAESNTRCHFYDLQLQADCSKEVRHAFEDRFLARFDLKAKRH